MEAIPDNIRAELTAIVLRDDTIAEPERETLLRDIQAGTPFPAGVEARLAEITRAQLAKMGEEVRRDEALIEALHADAQALRNEALPAKQAVADRQALELSVIMADFNAAVRAEETATFTDIETGERGTEAEQADAIRVALKQSPDRLDNRGPAL